MDGMEVLGCKHFMKIVIRTKRKHNRLLIIRIRVLVDMIDEELGGGTLGVFVISVEENSFGNRVWIMYQSRP